MLSRYVFKDVCKGSLTKGDNLLFTTGLPFKIRDSKMLSNS